MAQDLNIAERPEVLFAIADLIEAGVGGVATTAETDIGQSVSPSLRISSWQASLFAH
ncbi:hypothetical protein [Ferrimicrobium sp.]|uniref:hypothetical protein n=1 Tax=Ferrimicrobium sp. TaxID=2926050 RepID=UPI00263653B5|nr:hypothetical protein [Ferrimicrobium sp.]